MAVKRAADPLRRQCLCTGLAVLLLAGNALQAAEIFRWVDDEGVTHYSQWAPGTDRYEVSTLEIDTTTPEDYQPADDPYSIRNQGERIHALWSALVPPLNDAPSTRRGPGAADDADSAHDLSYAPLAYRPFALRPERQRVPLRRRLHQRSILEEVDRLAGPRAHSINSSVHRARIDAQQRALRAPRPKPAPGPRRDRE